MRYHCLIEVKHQKDVDIPLEYLKMRETIFAEERPSHTSVEPALYGKLVSYLRNGGEGRFNSLRTSTFHLFIIQINKSDSMYNANPSMT